MKKPTTVKELCEFIWYLEEKYNLLDFEIDSVKPWQAYRLEIYYQLGKYCGIFDSFLERSMPKTKKIKSVVTLLKNSLFCNPLVNLKKVDYLIFSHSRSKIIDDEPIDIYTDYFINDLLTRKQEIFIEFEEHYEGFHIREKKSYKKYLDYITLIKNIKKNFIKINLNHEQKEYINNINQEINKTCDIQYNLNKVLIETVKKFKVTYYYYKKIITKTKPKKIYLVVSYGNGKSELIQVAKEQNIETIEFQHGTFSKYHLGYSFPNRINKLDYFPDTFLVWNEYWKNLISFPILRENIRIHPFQYLETKKKKYSLMKKPNQMIILGQGGLTDSMIKLILDNLFKFKNFKIILKLHPEEYGKSEKYIYLSKLKKELEISVVENIDLYQLLSESEYQAGVFSTALYEGVEFQCKTILFNLPGIEYMDKFITNNNLQLDGNIYVP